MAAEEIFRVSTPMHTMAALELVAALLVALLLEAPPCSGEFTFEEATLDGIQKAFADGGLTSRQLVEHYQSRIASLNGDLHAVIEVNPDALAQADKADKEREEGPGSSSRGALHGVPVLLKDNIATKDRLNTAAGSLALLETVVPRDAFVVQKLRDAGAIILGKASLSEWSGMRSLTTPQGWSARGGQGMNPYTGEQWVCGSSSGSAISVAANMVAVALGTETDGSILCPASYNSAVGIKPTVGLTSRDGVVPISARQDTVGVISRTVTDAVHVLDVIAGADANDPATAKADEWIPSDKYKPSLKADGLKGKRLGILRGSYFPYETESATAQTFESLFKKMRDGGAELVDNITIDGEEKFQNDQLEALIIELKQSLNKYLEGLNSTKMRSLADIISFNVEHEKEEKIREYGQQYLVLANLANEVYLDGLVAKLENVTKTGLMKVMADETLDAVVAPADTCTSVLAIGGFPGITIPAGYDAEEGGFPFGICIGGLTATEPKLIEIAYALEQATRVRRPPPAPAQQGSMAY